MRRRIAFGVGVIFWLACFASAWVEPTNLVQAGVLYVLGGLAVVYALWGSWNG
jgi:hypothetical protein